MERKLTPDERRAIVDLYESRYASSGRSPRTIGWGSTADQLLRFDVLFRGIDPRGRTVLDVGCGFGDLVDYLDARFGTDYAYVGIDLAPSLIAQARAAHRAARREFVVGDVFEATPSEVDVAVLSGTLNFRMEDNLAYTQSVLRFLYGRSRLAVCANFLTTYVDFQDTKNYHHSPTELFVFARSLTRWVSLHHDYPLWEFTLQLMKNPRAAEGS